LLSLQYPIQNRPLFCVTGNRGIITVRIKCIRLVRRQIIQNKAYMGGGYEGYGAQVQNCTIIENSAYYGGGISSSGFSVFTNCIVWDNNYDNIYGEPYINYSDIQGGWVGEGNIDVDPLFVSGPLGDFYLSQIAAGQFENSPCLDSGSDLAQNICFDIPGNQQCMDELWTRTDGVSDSDQVDMGVHYPLSAFTASPPLSTPTAEQCVHDGDVDSSGMLTAGDAQTAFFIVLGIYTPNYNEECSADCNDDGIVTSGDAQLIFLAALGMDECVDPL